MILKFGVSTTATINSISAPQQLIVRSTSASDTQNCTLTGATSAPASVTETRALLGSREVVFTTNTLATLSGIKLASSSVGVVSVYEQGQKAVGTVTVNTQPADGDTLVIGLSGFIQTYTYKTTLTGAANEIKIGASIYATAQNAARAINAGTGAGTNYGTGTTANVYVTAWADSSFTTADLNGTSQTVIYIRDVIATTRLIAWSVISSTANVVAVAPTGGALGNLVTQLGTSKTQNIAAMTFYTPGMVTSTLVAGTTPTSDPITVSSKQVNLRFATGTVPIGILVQVEASDDAGTTWYNVFGTGTSVSLGSSSDQRFGPGAVTGNLGQFEMLRVKVVTNTNTVDVPFHAVLFSP